MPDVRICVCHPNEQRRQEIVQSLERHDSELVVMPVADLRGVVATVNAEKPQIVVVGVDAADDPAFRTIAAVDSGGVDVGIVVIGQDPSQEFLVACMRAGADEFLNYPLDAGELAKTLDRLYRKKGILQQPQGKAVALYSAKGGAGVTTLACSVAANVARQVNNETACCILDLNVPFGSVALALDVRQFSYSVADACRDSGRLDTPLLRSYMAAHDSGLAVLPAPLKLEEAEEINAQRLTTVITECQKAYEHVFLDLPHGLDSVALAALDVAGQILVVCDMTLPAIQHTIRAVEQFQELEYKKEKIKLVINRYYDTSQISLQEISEHVRLPVHWIVPYDSEVAIGAANSGQTLDAAGADSEVARSVVALAKHTAGIAAAEPKKKKLSLFSWKR